MVIAGFFFFLNSFWSQANLDIETRFTARSYPLAALVEAEAGYGVYLWNKKKSEKDYNYGFLRASSNFQTIGIINRFVAKKIGRAHV